ncbi:ABC transporter ATP-binding protein [Taishania pollutisoli]|nr:ABC transporter ATP-binding protein [Taishania pollutisoli]
MQSIIEIQSLVKHYPTNMSPAVSQVDFTVLKGEKFGIFGPNGAGKTTLISMMCGILQPTSGSIHYYINGKEITPKTALHTIGYVPQDFAFYPELTAGQNLVYFGKMYGIPTKQLHEKINVLLEQLGLSHVKNKKVMTFSGGMKRRINLAIGILNDPEILFLDEPTVGVDVQSKHAIIHLLEELNKNGTSILYTSHHLKEAEDFCDRIALIDQGKIIGLGTLEALTTQHEVENLEELLIRLTGKTMRD